MSSRIDARNYCSNRISYFNAIVSYVTANIRMFIFTRLISTSVPNGYEYIENLNGVVFDAHHMTLYVRKEQTDTKKRTRPLITIIIIIIYIRLADICI